jgi:hypothetical protein
MGEILGYFFAGFFAVWGVIIIVNTKETADTVLLKAIALLISVFMFAVSGMVLNATI